MVNPWRLTQRKKDSLDEEYTRGEPLCMYTTLWVAYEKTHCKPFDYHLTLQWVLG